MLDQHLTELEAKINLIEQRIEENDDFVFEDEFSKLYDELIEFRNMIQECDINSFPHDDYNEKREAKFHNQKKRLKKFDSRIKEIESEAGIEDGKDSDWMFDEDGRDDD